MYIPLDYYRILGLPIQATAEQLKHAHRDRTLQLPRREYSEVAIAARRDLIDEAFIVLTDPAQRQAYDSAFLANAYGAVPDPNMPIQDPSLRSSTHEANGGVAATAASQPAASRGGAIADPHISSIEIQEHQMVGALLILLELGEYELVLKLGRPFLSSGNMSLAAGLFGDPEVVGADVVLTVALACLELGREQWQQGQYENAAESLETGQELLLREGLFAAVRGEMQADLFKLRPYRILELLAAPDGQTSAHYQGIQLLQDMLHERGGIDGAGNDQSGLSTDDFLRFVQQLRSYLTAEEQHALFEAEAQRPSAVATYLAVYAMTARGFAYRMPALIRQAKIFLLRLGTRQDVQLEHSICALLLGQTEEASQALEDSKEYAALAFIRENSNGSPDLLPGLCLYAERWLQNEVFPHFRELAQQEVSLKAYFADDRVQAYLEALPDDAAASRWDVVTTPNHRWASQPVGAASATAGSNGDRHYRNGSSAAYGGSVATLGPSVNVAQGDRPSSRSGGATATVMPPVAERVSQTAADSPELTRGPGARREQGGGWFGRRSPSGSSPGKSDSARFTSPPSDRRASQAGIRLDRMVFLAAVGLAGIIVLWMVASRLVGWFNSSFGGPRVQGEPLALTMLEPVVPIPDPADVAPAPVAEAEGEITEDVARDVLQRWFEAKSSAMGDEHDQEPLETVLTGQLFSRWRSQSIQASQENWSWQFEHSDLEVSEVVWSEDEPDLALVSATVNEVGSFFVEGQLNPDESYDSTVSVIYSLIREEGLWKIEDVQTAN
ncbi:MAG: IMS domain-containing protein [Elainellaceae cyanobacterium]